MNRKRIVKSLRKLSVRTALAVPLLGVLMAGSFLVYGFRNAGASPFIVAQKSDVLTADNDADNVADPGDTIRYIVVVTNTGILDAGNVLLDDTIDANTTLVAGSLRTTPIARHDQYRSLGNVGITVPAASGVLVNDNDPDGSTVSVIPASGGTANSGAFAIGADGAFSYLPPTGFEGTDSFNYLIQDPDGNQDPATVFVVVTEMVWFIDNSAPSPGGGGLTTPFNSISAFNAIQTGTAPGAKDGDIVFLHSGSGNYATGIVLRNNQLLIGQGATASIVDITGITVPFFSNALPGTGARPTITTTSGDGVLLGQNNTVRGLNIGNTAGVGLSDNGGTVGVLLVSEMAISGTGGGIEVDNGGTLAVQLDSLNASSSSDEGVDLENVDGFISVLATNGVLNMSGVPAVVIDGNPSLALDLAFQSVSSTNAAHGISIRDTIGSFSVSGGGTLSGHAAEAVFLNNASNITLTGMTINQSATSSTQGIDATNVVNLMVVDTTITAGSNNSYALLGSNISHLTATSSIFDGGGGSVPNIDGVRITNLLGSSTITDSTFRNGKDINLLIENSIGSSSPDTLTISGATFSNSGGGDHLQVDANGTANLKLVVNASTSGNTTFSGTGQDGMQLEAQGNADLQAVVTQATISGNLGSAVNLSAAGNGHLIARVHNLTGLTSGGTNVINTIGFDTSIIEATIENNTIISGTAGNGIRVIQEDNGTITVNLAGNNISGITQGSGILVQGRAGTGGNGRINATINNNNVTTTGSLSLDGIEITSGSSAGGDTNTICLNMLNNSSSSGVFDGYFLRHRSGSTFLLQDFIGAATAADITNWVNVVKGNTGSVFVSDAAGFAAAPAPCATPTVPTTAVAGSTVVALVPKSAQLLQSARHWVSKTATTVSNRVAAARSAGVLSAGLARELVASLGVQTAYASGETVNVSLGDLNAGQQVAITFAVSVDATIPPNVNQVCNQGVVSGANFANVLTDDPAVGGATDPTCTSVPQADLSIGKSDSADPVTPGAGFNYNVTVANNGPSAAQDVVVNDTLPAGVVYVSDDCGAGSPSGGTLTWNVGTLANGGTAVCNINVTAPGSAGTITNNASVSGTTHDPDTGNNSSTEDTLVFNPIDLAISVDDGQTTAVPGTGINYTIIVSNNGPNDASGATVSDSFPAALTGVTWSCSASAGSSCTAAGAGDINDTVTILNGGSLTYAVSGSIDPAATGTLANTATVSPPAGFGDTNPADNSDTDTDTLTPEADLYVSKTDDNDPVTTGDNIIYTIMVNNAGPSDAQNVIASDTLPGSVTFVATSGCAEDPGGVPTCTLGSIPASGIAQYTIEVTANSDGLITNNVSVSSSTTDPDGGNNGASEDTTVNPPNVAPSNLSLTLDTAVIDEKDSVNLSGTFDDPDVGDTHTVTIGWGDGSTETVLNLTNDERDFSTSHQYIDDNPTGTPADDYTIAVAVEDAAGESDSATLSVTVNNADPVAGPIMAPSDPVSLNDQPISFTAVFTDPGVLDTHSAFWAWGDGSTSPGTVDESGGFGTVEDSHTYFEPGVYTLALTVIDDDTGADTAFYEFVVIYDPAGGFVTGGGWIDSPPGAYFPDPTLTGRATFGFVSKYKKGASTPTGTTEFQFRVADLNFHSDAYDWLVIANHRAMYKGTGTINGAGNYGFLITAIDAALTPSTDVDLFRIKIWDKDSDMVVYDNQVACSEMGEDADPCTEIGGGSIVIHKGKKK